MTLKQMNEKRSDMIRTLLGSYDPGKLTGLSKDLALEYRKAFREIEFILADLYASVEEIPDYLYMIKTGRLEALNSQIASIMSPVLQEGRNIQIASGSAGITNTFYADQYAVNWFSPSSGAGKTFFAPLPVPVITTSVLGTEAVWRDIPVRLLRDLEARGIYDLSLYKPQHDTLLEIILKNDTATLNRIKSTLTQGFLQGKGYREMVNDLKGDFNQSVNNSLRVIRTEGNRNQNAGAKAQTDTARSLGIDVRRQILATLDLRTREQSQEVDMRKENDDGLFEYPGGVMVAIPGNSGVGAWDINDRETTVDIVDGVDEDERRGLDPSTGETAVASYSSFDDWMRKNDVVRDPKYGILYYEPTQIVSGGKVLPVS